MVALVRINSNLFYILFLVFSSHVLAVGNITIQWSGIDGELLENTKQYVRLNQEKSDKLSESRINYLFDIADNAILESLRPFGYYNARVDSKLIKPSAQNANWRVNFTITLNEPVIIQSLHLKISGEAKTDPFFQQFIDNFPLQKGAALNHQRYEKGKHALKESALERGYLDAQLLTHEIKVYKKNNSALITLHLDSGPRYCIDHISFIQTQFKTELLARYIPFKNGALYSLDKLLDLRNALMESGYFTSLDIQKIKLENSPKHCIYLQITPQFKKKDSYRGRIGYGTDTSVRVGIDAKYNYLNRFGHSINGSLGYTVEKKRHLAKANYLIPMRQSKDVFLKFSLAYKAEDYTSSDINIDDVGGLTRVNDLSFNLAWHQPRQLFGMIKLDEVFSIEYLTEEYDLVPLVFDSELQDFLDFFLTPEELKFLTPGLKVLSFSLDWSYQNADNRLYTNRGYSLDLSIKGASKSLGSDVSYWQTRLKTKYIHRINHKSRLLFRSDMAFTDAQTNSIFDSSLHINQLPKALLFATGGDNSIRGYEFEELYGSALPLAKHLLVGSLEYEYEVYPRWSLAAFYDAGNVFNQYSDFDVKTGVGLGIRWHSPIGMIRLDVAHAGKRDGSPFRIHFTLGPDF